MQFSEQWLRDLVDPPIGGQELAHALTMAGLEVEAMVPCAPDFDHVVVARVVEVARHPNADRLTVCRVDVGGTDSLSIVCGAPNVRQGMLTACAIVGASLPTLSIKAAVMRGVQSQGMLCSSRELGLGEDHSGIMDFPADAVPGRDVRQYLQLDDRLITLKLTPNRGDCLSMLGVAREVSAIAATPIRVPQVVQAAVESTLNRAVGCAHPLACPLYLGRILDQVDTTCPTPAWMKRRLERSGVRSISAVVDITNYVMLELGQPLHAFDDERLCGAIQVRFARPGDRLTLLNGQLLTPDRDMLLITDDSGPVALAGVMGAAQTGVGDVTRRIFLEAAFFAPSAIAGRARRLGFSSDASYRFERGVDFGGTERAIERATALITEICGGQVGPISAFRAELPSRRPVRVRSKRLRQALGIDLADGAIASLLARQQLEFRPAADGFDVVPPTHRFDITIEEDVYEEVARMHGYDQIPATSPRAPLVMLPQMEAIRPQQQLREILVASDYHEVITFSFVEADWERDFAGCEPAAPLVNPIASHLAVMRSTLTGGLIACLRNNLNRKQSRVRVFELGVCFLPSRDAAAQAGYAQPERIGGLAYGPAFPEQWAQPTRQVDYFDVKADVERLLAPRVARYIPVIHPALHPGRAANVVIGDNVIGCLGELHPALVQKYELQNAPVIFELDPKKLREHPIPRYAEASKFPPATRDIAIVIDEQLGAQQVMDVLATAASQTVAELRIFDVYRGQGVESGKKSLAIRVVMQDTQKTLTDAELDAEIVRLVSRLREEFHASLRG